MLRVTPQIKKTPLDSGGSKQRVKYSSVVSVAIPELKCSTHLRFQFIESRVKRTTKRIPEFESRPIHAGREMKIPRTPADASQTKILFLTASSLRPSKLYDQVATTAGK